MYTYTYSFTATLSALTDTSSVTAKLRPKDEKQYPSEDDEDDDDLYTPPTKIQKQLRKEDLPRFLTRANSKDVDRMGVSTRQQQVVINNTANALGFQKGVSSTAVFKARDKQR